MADYEQMRAETPEERGVRLGPQMQNIYDTPLYYEIMALRASQLANALVDVMANGKAVGIVSQITMGYFG